MIEEVAERETIERSHLVRARCACGAVALVADGYAGRVLCSACRQRETGAGQGWEQFRGRFTPVIGYAVGEGRAPEVVRDVFPAPEWTTRDAGAPGVPPAGSVDVLAARARSAGWGVRVQCSRGRRPHGSTGKPLAVKTLRGVILRHAGGAAAYAIHDGAAWASVMLWGTRLPWFPHASVTDLAEFIDARGEMPDDWFDAIRARVEGSAERTKARAACNRGVHPLAELESRGLMRCPTCGNSWTLGEEPWRKPKVGKSEAL